MEIDVRGKALHQILQGVGAVHLDLLNIAE